MTPQRTKQLLDSGVLQAWAEGKKLQYRHVGGTTDGWFCLGDGEPSFDSPSRDWRVAPEPREIWVNEKDGVLYSNHWPSKEQCRGELDPKLRQVLFREVIE